MQTALSVLRWRTVERTPRLEHSSVAPRGGGHGKRSASLAGRSLLKEPKSTAPSPALYRCRLAPAIYIHLLRSLSAAVVAILAISVGDFDSLNIGYLKRVRKLVLELPERLSLRRTVHLQHKKLAYIQRSITGRTGGRRGRGELLVEQRCIGKITYRQCFQWHRQGRQEGRQIGAKTRRPRNNESYVFF